MADRLSDTEKRQWWTQRWQSLLRGLCLIEADAHIPELVRGARVLRMEVAVGEIRASIRDREAGDCEVRIGLQVLNDAQWETVIDALSSQALFSAQLLAGDMPQQIEQHFAQAGVALLPAVAAELVHECSCCSRRRRLCRPLLAAYLALGAMLDEDPWLIFRLRGRDRKQVLNELRVRRNRLADAGNSSTPATLADGEVQTGVYRRSATDDAASESVSLERQIEQYWGRSKTLIEFTGHVATPTIDLALLRRLGPLPVEVESIASYDLLAEIYGQVTTAGLALAYASEPDTVLDANGE